MLILSSGIVGTQGSATASLKTCLWVDNLGSIGLRGEGLAGPRNPRWVDNCDRAGSRYCRGSLIPRQPKSNFKSNLLVHVACAPHVRADCMLFSAAGF